MLITDSRNTNSVPLRASREPLLKIDFFPPLNSLFTKFTSIPSETRSPAYPEAGGSLLSWWSFRVWSVGGLAGLTCLTRGQPHACAPSACALPRERCVKPSLVLSCPSVPFYRPALFSFLILQDSLSLFCVFPKQELRLGLLALSDHNRS